MINFHSKYYCMSRSRGKLLLKFLSQIFFKTIKPNLAIFNQHVGSYNFRQQLENLSKVFLFRYHVKRCLIVRLPLGREFSIEEKNITKFRFIAVIL